MLSTGIRLRPIRALLVFNVEQRCGVMHGAVFVVVVADRAIEQVIAENAIEGFALRYIDALAFGEDNHSSSDGSSAGADQLAIHFHHAGIARLDRTQLRVITHLRNGSAYAVENFDQRFADTRGLVHAVDL